MLIVRTQKRDGVMEIRGAKTSLPSSHVSIWDVDEKLELGDYSWERALEILDEIEQASLTKPQKQIFQMPEK